MNSKKFLTSLVIVFEFAACNSTQTSQGENGYDSVLGTDERKTIQSEAVEILPYEPQIWIDNFLSDDYKDTLRVSLWSETSNRFLKEIPNDTTEDWWCWYQDQRVNAMLYLQNIKPLCLPYVYALAQCYPITEGEKRAVVILPYAAQPSNWVQCYIYTISNNKWVKQKSFSIALWDDCGGRESLKKCLVKKNGRWMYADQFDIDIEPKENPYQYLFD